MKTEISATGILSISSENALESYALKMWLDNLNNKETVLEAISFNWSAGTTKDETLMKEIIAARED